MPGLRLVLKSTLFWTEFGISLGLSASFQNLVTPALVNKTKLENCPYAVVASQARCTRGLKQTAINTWNTQPSIAQHLTSYQRYEYKYWKYSHYTLGLHLHVKMSLLRYNQTYISARKQRGNSPCLYRRQHSLLCSCVTSKSLSLRHWKSKNLLLPRTSKQASGRVMYSDCPGLETITILWLQTSIVRLW